MKYQFYTCDVFTKTRFGGNPLAVLPAAEGLSDVHMQQIAREFTTADLTATKETTWGGIKAMNRGSSDNEE